MNKTHQNPYNSRRSILIDEGERNTSQTCDRQNVTSYQDLCSPPRRKIVNAGIVVGQSRTDPCLNIVDLKKEFGPFSRLPESFHGSLELIQRVTHHLHTLDHGRAPPHLPQGVRRRPGGIESRGEGGHGQRLRAALDLLRKFCQSFDA